MRLVALALLLTLTPLAGCLDAAGRKRAEASGSLLAGFGPPTPAEAARMMADPFDTDNRYKGVTWISNAPWGGADVYLRAYRDMVKNDTDNGVRAVAARALAFHGTPDDATLITPLLKSDDKRVRQMAARALQRLHNPAVVPDLVLVVDRTKESDRDTRQAAASALGQYADTNAMNALIQALSDDDLAVSRTARMSLRTLTGTDAGEEPAPWRAWASAQTDPFAGQGKYLFPNFNRDKYLWEYIPLVPPPPNEPASTPIGYRPPGM